MDSDLFLQNLHDLDLEGGKTYLNQHIGELSDYASVGNLLADEALRLLYSPFKSLKLAELLIYYGDYVQHTYSHALGLKARGDALVQIGHFQAAIESLDMAGEEFLSTGDEGNWARTRISWITACASLGRIEEALQEATRAREVFLELGEFYWVSNIVDNTAVIYAQTGRYQDALDLYEKMQTNYPTTIGQSEKLIKRAIAIAKVNRAEIFSWLGKFGQAYSLYQQAEATFVALEEMGMMIYSETHLAELDYIQGYFGSALRRYYQACDSAVQNNIDNPLWLSELKFCTANCLVKLNRALEACRIMDEAVETYRQIGTSLQTSIALSEYATALRTSGRLQEALAALDEASKLFNQGGFHDYASNTKLQRAELLLELGNAKEAYHEASLVKKHFIAQGFVTRSIGASLIMADALVERVQQAGGWNKEQQSIFLLEAMNLCEEATQTARQHNLQEQVYKSLHHLGRFAMIQGDFGKAKKCFRAAIDQIEHILDNLVFDLSPSFLHTTWSVYEDMIALCLQQGQAKRAFSYLERARSMALRQYLSKSIMPLDEKRLEGNATSRPELQERRALLLRTQYELREWQEKYHDFSVLLAELDTSVSPTVDREVIFSELKHSETKINELFERLLLYEEDKPDLSHASRSRIRTNLKDTTRARLPIDVRHLHEQLSSNQLLLAYYLYKGNLVIFAITSQRLITYEFPNGVEQLERLIALLHAHLEPRGWSDYNNPPLQFVQRLLRKLYDLLVAPVESLLPSQPGHLTIVPYGLLHGLPFHALFDGSHYLVENFQVNYLPACSILSHLKTHKDKEDVLSIDTELSIQLPLIFGYSENGYLQRVHDEAKTIASLLNGECYLEGEATIARLTEQAPGSPIIHLATHGKVRMDSPNFSYVRLADGPLNAIDAFRLDLRDCELVTLSGCETGLALTGGGDEQLGLGRAFLAAGAASLVMSLWPVEDNATNDLMQLFYQNLMKGGTRAEALRAAQCNLLHRTPSIYAHPYFWAAFRLVGEVGPLLYNIAENRVFAFKAETLKG